MDAVATIESEVQELIRRSGLDPARDPDDVRRLVRDAVADYDARSLHGGLPAIGDALEAERSIWDSVAGYGPLQKYFDDPEIEEIWINEPSRVFVARGGVAELTTTILTRDAVRDLVERMLKSTGRRVDLSSPFVDAVLPDLSEGRVRACSTWWRWAWSECGERGVPVICGAVLDVADWCGDADGGLVSAHGPCGSVRGSSLKGTA